MYIQTAMLDFFYSTQKTNVNWSHQRKNVILIKRFYSVFCVAALFRQVHSIIELAVREVPCLLIELPIICCIYFNNLIAFLFLHYFWNFIQILDTCGFVANVYSFCRTSGCR